MTSLAGVGSALGPSASRPPITVTYLFGAGASHGSAKYHNCSTGILMGDLRDPIGAELRRRVKDEYPDSRAAQTFTNLYLSEEYDIEQVITFLQESPSAELQQLAALFRSVFHHVLSQRLGLIQEELAATPAELYSSVIDMHQVRGANEELRGILTLNYDTYIEYAIENVMGFAVDYGIAVPSAPKSKTAVTLLKLHGSFGWEHTWPISPFRGTPLWIPPGIQKAKDRYPFNLLWGKARELLDCDILRVVGCNLGTNDWDLISLLFSSQLTTGPSPLRCTIELIDRPLSTEEIRKRFPYLQIRTLLEIDEIGAQLVSELLQIAPVPFRSLQDAEQHRVLELAQAKVKNPFLDWLRRKAESMTINLGSIATPMNIFSRLLTPYS